MDAYVFIQTEPGLAGTVMETLVQTKLAARVVAVSGTYDLIARVERVELPAMTGRLIEGVHRVPGVVRSNTAFVVSIDEVMGPIPDIGPIPMPFRGMEWPKVVVLVLLSLEAGSGLDVVRALAASKRVMGMALISGKHDLMVQVGGPTLESVARTVLREIHPLAGVSSTQTLVVMAATAPAGRDAAKRRGAAKGKSGTRRRTSAARKRKRKPAAAARTTRRRRR